jgi:hypothetical protein
MERADGCAREGRTKIDGQTEELTLRIMRRCGKTSPQANCDVKCHTIRRKVDVSATCL